MVITPACDARIASPKTISSASTIAVIAVYHVTTLWPLTLADGGTYAASSSRARTPDGSRIDMLGSYRSAVTTSCDAIV